MAKLGVSVYNNLYGALVYGEYIPPPPPPEADNFMFMDSTTNFAFMDGAEFDYMSE
jgi:hypothetical protein